MPSLLLLAYLNKNSNDILKKAPWIRKKKNTVWGYRELFIALLSLLSLFVENDYSFAQSSPSDSASQLNSFVSSPQKSIHSFIHWQQKGHVLSERFIQPFALFEGEDEDKERLAQQLLKVLDARGLLVVYSEIPDNPNYVDSLSGLPQYILFADLPEVYLRKVDSQWLFSESTIEQIPLLYRATFSSTLEAFIDRLPPITKQEWLGLYLWQIIGLFVWILLALVIRSLFERILTQYVSKWAKKTRIEWDDLLLESVQKPLGLFVLIGFLLLSYTNLQFDVSINLYLNKVLSVSLSIAVFWVIYNLIDVFAEYLTHITGKTENSLDDQLVPLIRKTLRVFVVVLGVIVILQNNGYNVASLIAGLGIGGLAVALAAKDTLANLFGSITIFVDRPFRMGDWIKTSAAEGTVEEVGFRSTRIRTFYNSVVSVPNSSLANSEIDNLGMREYRRLKTILNLTYDTSPEQMEAFVEGIKAIVKANSNFRQDYYEIHFHSFGAHSLDVLVYVFFSVPDWSTELQQRHNFLLEILRLAKALKVEFAFPTQTLHIDSHKQGELADKPSYPAESLVHHVKSFGPNGEQAKPEGFKLYDQGTEINYGPKKT
jgi:MscS family membrane protein